MTEKRDWSLAIVHLTAAIVIAVGLPAGLYVMFETLRVIDSLKMASTDIGRGFMRGLQSGINETALEDLVRKLSQSAVLGTMNIPGNPLVEI
jgi:hypothetical protein